MKARAIVTAILVIVFLIMPVTVVDEADANPFWIYKTIAPLQGAIPPKITIQTPQNSTVYFSNNVTVSFRVDKPQMGDSEQSLYSIYKPNLYDIDYLLDNGLVYDVSSFNGKSYSTTVNFTFLPNGNHSLTVRATGVVLIGSSDPSKFWMSSDSTVYFSTNYKVLNQVQDGSDITVILGIATVCTVLIISSVTLLVRKKKWVSKQSFL